MFYDILRICAGEVVQVITATEAVEGTVLSVIDDGMILSTGNQASEGPQGEVVVRISAISYVRFLDQR
ncbi:hypothetical protein [Ectobacillus funiculus]|uniref:DUF2642 domain-containing protein n=1 Tax=Ectobacillus funiculus TaxID=137993 RepID=A0ABV5WH79_9BACI